MILLCFSRFNFEFTATLQNFQVNLSFVLVFIRAFKILRSDWSIPPLAAIIVTARV